jgi:hypothetical protein
MLLIMKWACSSMVEQSIEHGQGLGSILNPYPSFNTLDEIISFLIVLGDASKKILLNLAASTVILQ